MTSRGAGEAHGRMTILRQLSALRATVAEWHRAGRKVGVVPTMGALHAGHMALVEAARRDCDRVITTIFVNPKQFNRSDDLASYPRDEESDAARLAAADVDLLFAPPVEEVYPAGFETKIAVPGLSNCLCGLTRPGHMEGVATVVAKLFLMTTADRAYFGEKDYQQLLVVRRMAQDLDIPVSIVPVATVRDSDGLALSSRNALLSAEQRRQAPALYRTMTEMAAQLIAGAELRPVLESGKETLTAAGFEKIDYLEFRCAETLAELDRSDRPARLFAAAWLGSVRLIDNIPVPVAGQI